YVGPGKDRDDQQDQHDQLDRYAGIHQQGNKRHVARGLHSVFRAYFNKDLTVGPISTGRKLSASTLHTVTEAWHRSSSPRIARCSKRIEARPIWEASVCMVSSSSSFAGL